MISVTLSSDDDPPDGRLALHLDGAVIGLYPSRVLNETFYCLSLVHFLPFYGALL